MRGGSSNQRVRGTGDNKGRLRTVLPYAFLLLFPMCSLARQDTEQIDIPVVRSQAFRVPDTLTIRVRLTNITPAVPTSIRWRYGGEGQGGKV